MKKIVLVLLILPFLAFSQNTPVDLATWALTSNGNGISQTSNATVTALTANGVANTTFAADGVSSSGWTGLAINTANYYQITITPNAGEQLYIANLKLIHTRFDAGGLNFGPLSSSIRYYKSTSPGTVTTISTDAPSTTGTAVDAGINTYLASGESLVIRMYAWLGASNTSARWRIDANSLKLTGFSRLCGDYVIAGAQPAPFNNLTNAVTAVNNLGVSCAVRYLIDENQTTTTAYTINQFAGTSATNTLTIRPNTGDNITIQVNNVDGNSTTAAAFFLNGADNIVFDGNNGTANNNLKIFRNNSNNGNLTTAVIQLYNSADQNTIKNLTLQGTTNNANALSSGVAAGGTTIATPGNNSNNTIDNVIFQNTFFPVYVSGAASASNVNWTVKNSTVNTATAARTGFYIVNANNAVISGNTIDPLTYASDIFIYAAIYVIGNNVSATGNTIRNLTWNGNNGDNRFGIAVSGTNPTISNNSISNLTGGNVNVGAIYAAGSGAIVSFNTVNNVTASGSDRIGAGVYIDGASPLVHNNMINEVRLPSANNSGGGHGIYLLNATSAKVYFNTVRVSSVQNNGISSCLFIHSGSGMDVRNNIFVNTQASGGNRFAVYSASNTSPFSTINYNDYYVTPGVSNLFVGNLNGTRSTLANWQTATAQDANSFSYSPVFVSATDLHISALNVANLTSLEGKGTPTAITGITTDIDAELRVLPNDPGADEFGCAILGDQVTYGNGSWIGYVYDISGNASFNPPAAPFTAPAVYKGFVTEPDQFDRNIGAGAIVGVTTNVCGTYTDKFSVRYKMKKNFAAGYYTFKVGGDDGYRLKINNAATYIAENWNNHVYLTTTTNPSIYLSGDTFLDLEYYDNDNNARVSFEIIECQKLDAPTSITGAGPIICPGTTYTLTANGTFPVGTSLQWGTGNVAGANIVATTTISTFNVSPNATTTYWVRRAANNPTACISYSEATFITLIVATPSSNPTNFGSNTWNVYGYSGADKALGSGVTYVGYYTEPTVSFNTADRWPKLESPSSAVSIPGVAEGWSSSCTLPVNNFTMVHKRRGFPCGVYTITLNNWDDGTILLVDGVEKFNCAVWSGGGGCTGALTGTFNLNSTSTIEIRTEETGGDANLQITIAQAAATESGSLTSASDKVCVNNIPRDVVLSGTSNTIVRWQSSSTATFTPATTVDIASTNATLTGAQIGALSATRYIRAVLTNSICAQFVSATFTITVPAMSTYNNGWNVVPDQYTPVTIASNFTLSSDLNVCSCIVNTNRTFTVPDSKTLIVQNNLTINGTGQLIVENNGSLVQVNDNAVNTGDIKVYRKTSAVKQYDYVYWSSPVKNSPLSVFGNVYMYMFDGAANDWIWQTGSSSMENGRGYIVRAPENGIATQVLETLFTGRPNNGLVQVPVATGTDVKYNLIGNPYPSALDADAFIANSNNNGILSGTLYFWTHSKAISNTFPDSNGDGNTYNYTTDDYAKYNLTGGVKTAPVGVTAPTGKIGAGQAFFIETQENLSGSKSLVFNNSMRVQTANSNSQFYRTASGPTATATPESVEKNRLWLNLTNTQGAYDETLLGYITGATNGLDYGYDGNTFAGGNVVSLYSILDDHPLSIQGRDVDMSDADVIPLGFDNTIGGTFTIAIDNKDGFFVGKDVYLVDKLNNITTNIKDSGYTFTTEIGTFNDRFELRFTTVSLGVDTPVIDKNTIGIIRKGGQIQIASKDQNIAAVQIFDLLGRVIYQKDAIDATTFATTDLSANSQVIIVKVKTENGAEVVKKVIMN